MKVIFGGNIKPGGQDAFIYNAFVRLGVDIQTFDFSQYFKLSFLNRVFNKLRITRVPRYFGTALLNKHLLGAVERERPDFVLLNKPILVWPETVKQLTRITKVFSWYPDYVLFPMTSSPYFYRSIPLYDCHFSYNFENSKELIKWGAKKSLFLPCAADLDCHAPVEISEQERKELGADIVFVGTFANEERFWFLEKLCQEGYDIKIYGNSWGKCPKTSCLVKKGCIQFKEMCCKEMSKVFNASKVVLSFVREHNKEVLACRTYEIPACGAFMLHQWTEKIEEVLGAGKEADFFKTYEELKQKIDFYLAHDDLRREIAQAGRKKIIEGGHLFTNRIQEMVDVFKTMK